MMNSVISPELQNEITAVNSEKRSPWYIQMIIFVAGILSVGFFIGFAALLFRDESMILPMGVLLTVGSVAGYFFLPKENDYLNSVLFAFLAAGEGLLFAEFHDSVGGILFLIIMNLLLFIFMPLFTARLLIPGVIMLLSIALIGQFKRIYGSTGRLMISHTLSLLSLIYTGILIWTYVKGVETARLIPGKINSIRAGLFLAVLCAWNPVNFAEALFQQVSGEPLWTNSSFIAMGMTLIMYMTVITPLFLSIYPTGKKERTFVLIMLIFSVLLGITSVRLMLALQLMMIAHIRGDRKFMLFASTFLLLALSTYYYSLHITLLMKSVIMIITGGVSLVGWRIVKRKEVVHG